MCACVTRHGGSGGRGGAGVSNKLIPSTDVWGGGARAYPSPYPHLHPHPSTLKAVLGGIQGAFIYMSLI